MALVERFGEDLTREHYMYVMGSGHPEARFDKGEL